MTGTMREVVFVTYAQSFNTNEIGSKFYYRDEIDKEKWQDLMDLYNLQREDDHVRIHVDDEAMRLWSKWLYKEVNFKDTIFDTTCRNISNFYAIFVFNDG